MIAPDSLVDSCTGAAAVGLDIEIAPVAAVATAAVAIADEKSSLGQLTRAVGTVGVSGYNELKKLDEENGFSSALRARAIDSAITVVEKAADAPGAKALTRGGRGVEVHA